MAISRGAGTEIIRSIHLEIVDATYSDLIVGVQHHIYTVLSVISYCNAIQAAGNFLTLLVEGYDSKEGTSAQYHYLFRQDMQLYQTYVWNDKFSFNGFEPTNFTGPMDDATKQDAIADQGSSVAQSLIIRSENADDNFHVHCTYIDQNNA
jgi:hypothetical protein